MSHTHSYETYRQLRGSGDLVARDTRVGLRAGHTAGQRVITLPCAKEAFTAARGRPLLLKDEDGVVGNVSGTRVVVKSCNGQTIDGAKEVAMTRSRGVLEVYSDGENWQVIRNGAP